MITIQEITDQSIWKEFLLRKEIAFFPFFQSWEWGEVERKRGRSILRIGIFDSVDGSDESGKNVLVGVCLIIDVTARRGHYFHLRHGPVFLQFTEKYFNTMLDYIKKTANEKQASFIRLSPLIQNDLIEPKNLLKNKGSLDAPIHNMDSEICWILDIQKPEDQLLKEMRKTHRYLIRKAEGMDIKIIRTEKLSDVDKFIDLYNNLSLRKHFVPHSQIKEEFEEFVKEKQTCLFLAEYQNKIIAAAFITFVNKMAIYRHGASLDEYRQIPASYLLQWEAIKEAKKRNMSIYNFWGIAPSDKKNHPWRGLTLFKTGFGGSRVEFLHAQDIPLSLLYWRTYAIDFLTKLIKGY